MNYTDFNQVLRNLECINISLEDIRQKIVSKCGVSYESQDARHVALDGLQSDIVACANWIYALIGLQTLAQEKYSDSWESEYTKLLRTNLASGHAEDLMLDYLRNTLTTKVHFKIENLFSNLLKSLSDDQVPIGYWNICNTLLSKLGVAIDGREKKILLVLANLRNSFHSNGIHNTKHPLNFSIDGLEFDFINGAKVKCASWMHIVVILRANFQVLESLLLSRSVSNFCNLIPDSFAESTD